MAIRPRRCAKLKAKSFYLQIYADLTNFQKNNLKSDAEPLTIAVPKCFYSRYSSGLLSSLADDSSPEPPESILVLQDMRPLGYQTANLSKGLTLEEAESAIEAIAAIHALTLGMKIKEKIDLNEKYPVNGEKLITSTVVDFLFDFNFSFYFKLRKQRTAISNWLNKASRS